MRLFLFLLLLLGTVPRLSRAQLFGKGFETGSYVLREGPAGRQPGQLNLRNGTKLLLKTAEGKTQKLTPEQIQSFRLGPHTYVTAADFQVKGAYVERAFVEQLDSGQVVLLQYAYSVGAPMAMGAGGGMSYGGSSNARAWLLARPGDARVTPAQGGYYSGGGKQFREAVRPYLSTRPDLVQLLDEKRITEDNLPAVIHALNQHLPFSAAAPGQGATEQ